MTNVVCFIDANVTPENDDDPVTIREHFIGFVPMKESTGLFITSTLLKQLEKLSFDLRELTWARL